MPECLSVPLPDVGLLRHNADRYMRVSVDVLECAQLSNKTHQADYLFDQSPMHKGFQSSLRKSISVAVCKPSNNIYPVWRGGVKLSTVRTFSRTTMVQNPFKPAARVAGQKQDVWYVYPDFPRRDCSLMISPGPSSTRRRQRPPYSRS